MKNGGTIHREQVVREELLRSFDPAKGGDEILAIDRLGDILFELHLRTGQEQKETTLLVVGGHSPMELATQFCAENDIMLQERPFIVSMILQKYQFWKDQSQIQQESQHKGEKVTEKNNEKNTEKNNFSGVLLWPVFTLGLIFVAASFQKTNQASGSNGMLHYSFPKKMEDSMVLVMGKWERFTTLLNFSVSSPPKDTVLILEVLTISSI